MITFIWHRRADMPRNGVRYALWDKYSANLLGQCFYMPGSKHYRCAASAPVKGGMVLTTYHAGTMRAAMDALERDWSKRSIGLFGEDDIEFREA